MLVNANESAKVAPAKSESHKLLWGILLGVATILSVAFNVPQFVPARTVACRSACIANLMLIEGAKSTWALENKKELGDVPSEAELFGPAQYLRERPECPQGGVYTVGAVGENPKCSIQEHNRQFEESHARTKQIREAVPAKILSQRR